MTRIILTFSVCALLATGALRTAAAAPVDVEIGHFEITQGLQNKANSVPLVAGRPTVVRIFPRVVGSGGPVAGVSGRLHAFRDGTELPGSPIAPNVESVT